MAQEKNIPENVTFTIPLIDLKVYNKKLPAEEGLIDTIFNVIPWTRLSFPICTYRKHVTGNEEDRGNSVVGIVDDVDVDNKQFIITIFGKHSDTISYFEDVVIMPRAIENDKGEVVIQSLLVGPKSDWEWMTKPPQKKFNNNRRNNNYKK